MTKMRHKQIKCSGLRYSTHTKQEASHATHIWVEEYLTLKPAELVYIFRN